MMSIHRFATIMILTAVIFVIYVVRLVVIQVVQYEDHLFFAERQQIKTETIRPGRGSIYDRDMNLLVYDKRDVSFFVNAEKATLKKHDSLIAKAFSDSLGMPVQYYRELFKSKKRKVCVAKKLDAVKALQLKGMRLVEYYSEDDPTRVYQYGSLASHIIGYINNEYVGTEGLESSNNRVLKGTEGSRVAIRDGSGEIVNIIDESTRPSQQGNNIVLTISKDIQKSLEEALKKGMEECQAEYAMGVVMNPNTGEILGLANADDYDPNHYSDYNDEIRRNKVVADVYEPGSTFKGIAMSVFLDKGICNENEVIFLENGSYKKITDSHSYGSLSVKQVFAKSSNIGMSKLSERIDEETFYSYLRDYGFGLPTGIELPSETRGTLRTPDIWSKSSKSSLSYGYEVSVTALQLITAYSAIVNGGTLYKPFIIKKITDKDGELVKENKPVALRKVIAEKTSAKMREFLVEVVKNGTGQKAAVDKLPVGGKTGTSRRIVHKEYSTEYYNSSFVGFFPADKPAYICLIVMNSPKTKSIYGGEVAAPVFAEIAKRIATIDPLLKQYMSTSIESSGDKIVVSKPSKDSSSVASGISGIQDSLIAGKSRHDSSAIQFEINVRSISPDEVTLGIMPDLKGVSIREAVAVLTKLGVRYELKGSGKILAQSLAAGTRIKRGLTCELKAQEISKIRTVLY